MKVIWLEIHKPSAGDIYRFIEIVGKTSTQRPLSDDSERWFYTYVVQQGHLGLLEHIYLSFEIEAPRFVIDQLTRHRHISWVVESTQRVKYTLKDFEKAYPNRELAQVNYEYYRSLLKATNKRTARQVLPLSISTRAIGSCNIRAFLEMIAKRLVPEASPETQKIVRELFEEFKRKAGEDKAWNELMDKLK